MDAITLLKNDHKTVKKLFREFEQAHKKGAAGRAKLVKEIVEELTVHAAIEEAIFYPAVRSEVPDLEDDILESLEEHHGVKWTCLELTQMDPSDERFDAKVIVLSEHVNHHVKEEEERVVPQGPRRDDTHAPHRARGRDGEGEEDRASETGAGTRRRRCGALRPCSSRTGATGRSSPRPAW